MSESKAILMASSIEFGYAYMKYEKGGFINLLLLVAFAGCVLTYQKMSEWSHK